MMTQTTNFIARISVVERVTAEVGLKAQSLAGLFILDILKVRKRKNNNYNLIYTLDYINEEQDGGCT